MLETYRNLKATTEKQGPQKLGDPQSHRGPKTGGSLSFGLGAPVGL